MKEYRILKSSHKEVPSTTKKQNKIRSPTTMLISALYSQSGLYKERKETQTA